MSKLLETRELKGGVTLLLTQEKQGKYVIWKQTTGTLFDSLTWIVIAPHIEQAKLYLEDYSK